MAGIHLQAQLVGLVGSINETLQLNVSSRGIVKAFGKRAGMQLNKLTAGLRGRSDLVGIGSDEQAHLDAAVVHFFASLTYGRQVPGNIQAAFRGDLLPPLRNETNDVRF